MIAQHADAHKLDSDPLALTPLEATNERLYAKDGRQWFRVPVTLVRQGFVKVLARDTKSAEGAVRAYAAFADDVEDSVQSEQVGQAVPL